MKTPESQQPTQPTSPATLPTDGPRTGLLGRRTFVRGALGVLGVGVGAGAVACSSGETPAQQSDTRASWNTAPPRRTEPTTPTTASTTTAPESSLPSPTNSETPSPTETINPRTKEAQETMLRLAGLIATKYKEPGESLQKQGDGATEYGIARVYDKSEVIAPPNGRKTLANQIMVDTVESESDMPDPQKATQITFSDQRRTMPRDYDESWYGDYSVKKYVLRKNDDGSFTIIEDTRINKDTKKASSQKIRGEEYPTISVEYKSDDERQADAFNRALKELNKKITDTLGVPASGSTPTTTS